MSVKNSPLMGEVVLSKVSVLRCDEYDVQKIKAILLESIENLGGLSPYVDPKDRVLLKVNLLAKKKPEEATTTHPAFVQALAEIFIENGNKVVIGDSPGGPFSQKMLSGIYNATGMTEVAEKTGATLNLNVGSIERQNPTGAMLKNITVTSMLNDVDKVISVSKMKTHKMMTFTGAIKNMFGIIPGIMKAEYHLNMPEYDTFGSALVDICLCANPVLSFMDGIEAMEGEGPSSGTVRRMNTILASESPYHLDKVACGIIGLDIHRVPVLKACIERGMISDSLDDVELSGVPIADVKVDDFVIPHTTMLNPAQGSSKIVMRILNAFVQPRLVFNKEKCIGCGICAANCPAKVITMKDKKPEVNSSKCIRCYCCQELCPEKAITVHRPFILRKLTGQ